MELTIDIGNSYTKFCIFDNDAITFNLITKDVTEELLVGITGRHTISHAIISSVTDNKKHIGAFLEHRGIPVLTVTHTTAIPIRNCYGTPETLGMDRLSAAVGAYRLRPGEASLIIDIGTCITYDVIDETGSFLGGNIAPGYKMRLDAMHAFTDKLPDVPPCDIPDYRIGRSTTEAMKAGAYNGIVYEAEGMVAYLRGRYGRLNVFLTGGGAAYFAQNIGCGKIAEPNLIHIGLNEILRYNLKLTTE